MGPPPDRSTLSRHTLIVCASQRSVGMAHRAGRAGEDATVEMVVVPDSGAGDQLNGVGMVPRESPVARVATVAMSESSLVLLMKRETSTGVLEPVAKVALAAVAVAAATVV